MQKWEYLTLESSRNYGKTKYIVNNEQQAELTNEKLSVVLNKIGRQGWEMVGVSPGSESGQLFVFKRLPSRTTELLKEKAATNGQPTEA
jgi:hypothetical protein